MEKEIKKQLEEVIKNNLPQQVGELLQQRLATTDALEFKVKELNNVLDTREKTIRENRELISELHKIIDELMALKDREDKITEKEKAYELEVLKIRYQAEQDKNALVQDTLKNVFRNPQHPSLISNTSYSYSDFYNNSRGQYEQRLGNTMTSTNIIKED